MSQAADESTTIMNAPPSTNSTSFNLLFFDLTVDKSIDLISTTFRQVFQLLICFAVMFIIGKLSCYLNIVSTACTVSNNESIESADEQHETNESELNVPFVEKENPLPAPIQPQQQQLQHDKTDNAAKSSKTMPNTVGSNGWDSELIPENCSQPENQVQNKYLKAKTINKHLKRKCMSVGPIMLTPDSQLIRCLDADEREERYTYKTVPPCDALIANNASDRVDVCVPQIVLTFSPLSILSTIYLFLTTPTKKMTFRYSFSNIVVVIVVVVSLSKIHAFVLSVFVLVVAVNCTSYHVLFELSWKLIIAFSSGPSRAQRPFHRSKMWRILRTTVPTAAFMALRTKSKRISGLLCFGITLKTRNI